MINTSVKNIHSLVDIKTNLLFNHKQILSCKALKFLADIHLNFNSRRLELLAIRSEKQNLKDENHNRDFVESNTFFQNNNSSFPVKFSYFDNREVEVVRLEETYVLENDLLTNSKLFVINFESSEISKWTKLIELQRSIIDTINSSLKTDIAEDDRIVNVIEKELSIMICPRDIVEEEKNIYIDNEPLSSSIFDLGFFLFHNVKLMLENSFVQYIYLNSIQNYYEAKFWRELFTFTEEELRLPEGTIKVFVNLDEKLPLFERNHIFNEMKDYLIIE